MLGGASWFDCGANERAGGRPTYMQSGNLYS